MKNLVVAAVVVALVSGCATTNETALAPNVVRLDTTARGALFAGSAGETTLRRAAEATVERGYTHFRIIAADSAQGRQLAGFSSNWAGNATATTYGNTTYASGSGFGTSMPIYAPTASVSMIVEMFNHKVEGSFAAVEVLAD